VIEEVAEEQLAAHRVDVDEQVVRHGDLDRPALERGLEPGEHAAHELLDGDPLARRDLARRVGDGQQVLERPGQPLRLVDDRVEIAAVILADGRAQNARAPRDHRQRRAQIVGDRGEQRAELFGRPARSSHQYTSNSNTPSPAMRNL
jgi:hypothetical protein